MTDIIREVAGFSDLVWCYAHNPETFAGMGPGLPGIDILMHGNAEAYCLDTLPEFRGFHMIRDPRDVVVSNYFSHLHSHPEKVGDQILEGMLQMRKRLRDMPKDDGMMFEIEKSGRIFGHMSGWNYGDQRVLELKMEDVIRSPEDVLPRAFRFIGLVADEGPGDEQRPEALPCVSTDQFLDMLLGHRFAVKSGGREPGEEDVHSHYRKGVAGDWKNHFTEKHKDYFKRTYPGLVVQLGYEEDDNW